MVGISISTSTLLSSPGTVRKYYQTAGMSIYFRTGHHTIIGRANFAMGARVMRFGL